MFQELKTEIAQLMTEARANTLKLFDLSREEDLHVSPGFGFRPIIWHLAHVGVFESYWLLQKMKGENAPDERYERIFDPIKTPREASVNLPSRKEMENYLTRVREGAMRYLDEVTFDENNPMLRDAYVFHLVLQHEYQHQETLCYLFQMLSSEKKINPLSQDSEFKIQNSKTAADNDESIKNQKSKIKNRKSHYSALRTPHPALEEGDFLMGCVWKNIFAYDNEFPAHKVFVPAFKIDSCLTTNEEFLSFVEEGCYTRREFWSEEGWAWREKENWKHPLYWNKKDGIWFEKTMFDEKSLRLQHPVIGVSWYEAEAYAKFMKKRLPTEAEWEKAASWKPVPPALTGESVLSVPPAVAGGLASQTKNLFAWGNEAPSINRCNFNISNFDTTPIASFSPNANGCFDMTGNVWEWTNDSFNGFDGFQYFPYPEYSEEWFDGDHRVLKGGSYATRSPILRTSFRNFFRRHFRIAFAGIRLAEDI
jgi:ergothioneine biosynthesis protein EgtB